MLCLMLERAMSQRCPRNRAPAIKLLVGPIVSGFQHLRLQSCRTIDNVPRVIQVPVAGDDASLAPHLRIKPGARVRGLDVKGGGSDAVGNGPIYGAPEYVFAIVVHAEDEAAVNHDAKRMQPVRNGFVIPSEVLPFVAAREVAGVQGLKADEDAAQSRFCSPFNQVPTQNGVHGCRTLEQPPHPFHAIKERLRKAAVPQKVVIQKIKVASGQPRNLSQGVIHPLRVAGAAALKKCVFVAKVAVLGTAARYHNRIWNQVATAADEITAYGWNPLQSAPSE